VFRENIMSRRRYLTSHRLSEIHAQLRDEDWDLLRTLAVVRVATGLQLQRLHHGGDEAAKQRRIRQLARLSRWRVVVRLSRRIGGVERGSVSSCYCLDVAGQRLLDATRGRSRAPWTPSTPFISHALAVTELYVAAVEAERFGPLELLSFSAEPACWRTFPSRRGEGVILKPDAHVVIASGEFEYHWYVEIDRATESRPRITAKARLYVEYYETGLEQTRHDVFPQILWAVPDAHRQSQIIDALAKLDAETWHLFAVTTFENIVAGLVSEVDLARPAHPERSS
jgi:hypothetical protein